MHQIPSLCAWLLHARYSLLALPGPGRYLSRCSPWGRIGFDRCGCRFRRIFGSFLRSGCGRLCSLLLCTRQLITDFGHTLEHCCHLFPHGLELRNSFSDRAVFLQQRIVELLPQVITIMLEELIEFGSCIIFFPMIL